MSTSDRIREYLQGGGLFNPEMADHDAVRDLLMDCHAELAAERDATREEVEQLKYERDVAIESATINQKRGDEYFEKMRRMRATLSVTAWWMENTGYGAAARELHSYLSKVDNELVGDLIEEVKKPVCECGHYEHNHYHLCSNVVLDACAGSIGCTCNGFKKRSRR